ncbi:hypothetical protein [Kitasatospora sp. NPDC001095]
MGRKPGRSRTRARRQLIDGIRWRTRTGAPCYRPWKDAARVARGSLGEAARSGARRPISAPGGRRRAVRSHGSGTRLG